jgi:hypothetical protein
LTPFTERFGERISLSFREDDVRSISDKQGKTLKAATRRSVDMAGGGDAFQHATRVNAASLSKYVSPNEDNAKNFMPIDVAVEADMEAGSPIILAAMAEMLGCRVVPVDQGSPEHDHPLTLMDGLRIANEAADVVRAITQALENENLDALERKEITREADQAIKALQLVLRKIGGAA